MASLDVVGSAVGGMVGMGGALAYGFKLLVDVLGKQLSVQNKVISSLESDVSAKLDRHIDDCKECRGRRRE